VGSARDNFLSRLLVVTEYVMLLAVHSGQNLVGVGHGTVTPEHVADEDYAVAFSNAGVVPEDKLLLHLRAVRERAELKRLDDVQVLEVVISGDEQVLHGTPILGAAFRATLPNPPISLVFEWSIS
jgi:hypothetical protein